MSMKKRPVEQRTCLCGKVLGSRSWLVRHRKKCDVWNQSTEQQIMNYAVRSFSRALAESIYQPNSLMRHLTRHK